MFIHNHVLIWIQMLKNYHLPEKCYWTVNLAIAIIESIIFQLEFNTYRHLRTNVYEQLNCFNFSTRRFALKNRSVYEASSSYISFVDFYDKRNTSSIFLWYISWNIYLPNIFSFLFFSLSPSRMLQIAFWCYSSLYMTGKI